MCQGVGRAGGTCRGGTQCGSGLTCFSELTSNGGMEILLNSTPFPDIPVVMPDPANPGEYVSSDASVPLGFGPGGQCSQACNPSAMTATCPACSTCSKSIGGSPSFSAVGFSPRSFDQTGTLDATNSGICRANCTFDPSTSGCQAGYSCDSSENVCLEACTTDAQCNLGWDVRRHDGLVAVIDGSQTCNMDTGRCEWTPPSDAAYGSACEASTDCLEYIGFCGIGNHCGQQNCAAKGSDGNPVYPCPSGAQCLTFPNSNDASQCFTPCTSPSDCFDGVACVNLGPGNFCYAACQNDSECKDAEACRLGGFSDPTIGTCQPRCDPAGSDCAADEVCAIPTSPASDWSMDYGFCRQLNQICTADADCYGGQACEVLADDQYGQCTDGCQNDSDCTDAALPSCRIQPGGEPCTVDSDCNSGSCTSGTCAPSTYGVCRVLGGECAVSPDANMDGIPDIPLRGDPQCLESQRCNSSNTCEDRPVSTPDAGTAADGGAADGGVPDGSAG